MIEYLALLRDVLDNGTPKEDRTGTGTLSLFGRQFRVDLNEGFPLLTTKELHVRSIVHELLWMISGSTNVRDLQAHGVTIWDEWADPITGELGPVYGAQWRAWPLPGGGTFDQLAWLLRELKANPDSRRLVISAWNVADLGKMAIAPCHCMFQFNTRPMDVQERIALFERQEPELQPSIRDEFDDQRLRGGEIEARVHAACDAAGIPSRFLDCQLYQRSADIFLGVPFNIASYALLLHLVARHVNMEPGEFIHSFGDLHLYRNHIEQAKTQLSRHPKRMPQLVFAPDAPTDLFKARAEHFSFGNYFPHPSIKAPVAV